MTRVTARGPSRVAGLRLVELVGSGGEGEVWEAYDATGRRRALKLIAPDMLAEAHAVAQRAAWLVRIRHRALVRVHRCGVLHGPLEGWGFVEMDLVDGPSLERAPGDPAALERLAPLAEALDMLHTGVWSDGVPLVHRDVKPANIIDARRPGGSDGDRGLVLVDPSTLRGADATVMTRIGTPLYAPPEALTGRVGPAADVYSFAATAVALLTGARGDELARLLATPGQLDLPHGVRAALSPFVGDRPVSCRAVLERTIDLRDDASLESAHVATADPRKAPPVAEGVDHWPPWRSRRVWPALTVLAMLLGTGAASVAGLLPRELTPLVVVGGVLLHLLAHAAARRSLRIALLAPPVAWSALLASRTAPPGPARSWLDATLLAWLAAGVLAVGAGGTGDITASASLLAAAGAFWGVVLSIRATRRTSARVALLPVWLLGVVVLLTSAVLLLPAALLLDRGRPLARYCLAHLGGVRAFAARSWHSGWPAAAGGA